MSNRSKTWLIIAATFSIITVVAWVGATIALGFNLYDLEHYYLKLFKLIARGVTDTDALILRLVIMTELIISAIINLVCAMAYIKVSMRKYATISDYLTLCTLSAVQLIFGLSFIPAALVLIIALRNKHIYDAFVSTNQEKAFDALKSEIVSLNKLRDRGMIDYSTYTKQLDVLLSNHASNQKDN